MSITATKVVPDLLYYINNYVVNSTANKSKIPFPDTFLIAYLEDNKSFIRLLFDENWPITSMNYRYLFREETDLSVISQNLRTRLSLYPANSKLYLCDSDSTSVCSVNIFGIEQDDLSLLDKLLQYRIDTTSCDITTIVYEDLNTNLSKLIYIYLKFKIDNDYTLFDNETPISDDNNVLQNFFESFIIDKIYIYLSSLST